MAAFAQSLLGGKWRSRQAEEKFSPCCMVVFHRQKSLWQSNLVSPQWKCLIEIKSWTEGSDDFNLSFFHDTRPPNCKSMTNWFPTVRYQSPISSFLFCFVLPSSIHHCSTFFQLSMHHEKTHRKIYSNRLLLDRRLEIDHSSLLMNVAKVASIKKLSYGTFIQAKYVFQTLLYIKPPPLLFNMYTYITKHQHLHRILSEPPYETHLSIAIFIQTSMDVLVP